MNNKTIDPDWVDNLRKELFLSKRTHNFTLTRDEVMYLIGGLEGLYFEEHSPVATDAMEMLEFLAGRMEFGGIGGSVAKVYAKNIRQLQRLLSIKQGESNENL